MQTFRNHFRTQKIDWSLRYPIALAFKIVGRCRSVFEAKEMAIEYKSFIYSLPISIEAKAFFVRDLEENWISQEWILGFIDGGRLPNYEDGTNLVFNAGLVTYWNSRTIEHQNGLYRPQPDIVRRINQGRLKVLQNYVIEVPDKQNLFYVRMSNSQQNTFRSPYTADKIKFEDNEAQGISKMIKKLAAKHIAPQINENDPYRPSELPKRKHTTVGLSKVNIETKNQIAIENEALNNHHDTYTFNEDISTITLNNSETNLDNSNKLSIIMEDCNDQDSMLTPSSSNNISESAFTSSIQPKSRNPLVPLTAIENMNIPHSVEQLRTKRIRNNKRKGALEYNKNTEIVSSLPPLRRRKIDNPALEELFDKQGIGWNRKEFAKECQVQNIRLDDDDIINATKL
ncbi:17737_t:CDS:2, partial [Cetraspora pellucida]